MRDAPGRAAALLVIALTALGCRGRAAPEGAEGEASVAASARVPPTRRAAGEPCSEEGAAACSDEGKAVLRCRAGKLVVANACRGAAGCAPRAGTSRVLCDDAIADEGDPCEVQGQPACSGDGAAELACDGAHFVRRRACTRPCAVVDAGVRCD